jgi:DNA-binding SARP family transcriptional activator
MEFGVLGPLQVRSDGRPVPVGAPMQRALLAALLLHANQVVAAEQLIDYLWDQTPPPSARTTLQNYILRLRRLLPARPERVADQLLVTRAPGYLLQLRPGELDLDRFQGLVVDARASTTQGQLERAASLLRDALALWRGPPLCDVASETLRRLHLPRLEDQRLGALEARIDAELGLGLHGELTGELHGLVDEQPLRERFRAQLMLALYRCGRQAEALEVYRSTWRLLSDELGIQPGAELRRLEQVILAEDSSLDLPASVAAGRPPAAAISPPHQLPPAIADFTGRRQHLDELDRLLESEADTTAVVLSAIAGTAGVGKTALAIHWAHRSATASATDNCTSTCGATPRPRRCAPSTLWLGSCMPWACPPSRCRWSWRRRPGCTARCWPTSACWWCWTTPAAPTRSAPCCRAAPAAWSWSPAATGWAGWWPATVPGV